MEIALAQYENVNATVCDSPRFLINAFLARARCCWVATFSLSGLISAIDYVRMGLRFRRN